MQYITILKLAAVHHICDIRKKSKEHMLQLMRNNCNVDDDTILNYLSLPLEEKKKLFKEIISLLDVMLNLEYIN
jgi:hypothetical protein